MRIAGLSIKPMWIVYVGAAILAVLLLNSIMGTRHPQPFPWVGPGGTRKPWLGPGGTRTLFRVDMDLHPYEGFTNPSDAAASGAETTFYMFGMEGCPHCIKAKPDFMALGSTMTIAGQSVAVQYLDQATDKARIEATGCEVSGYPTFCLVHKGQTHKYVGAREPEAYKAYIAKILAGSA